MGADAATDADDALVARPGPCLRCRGTRTLPCVSCLFCAFRARLAGVPTAWFLPESIHGGNLPCGHEMQIAGEWGAALCPDCQGSGEAEVWKTAAKWARRDAKDAREKKQAASEAAKVLKEQGGRAGYSARCIRRLLHLVTPRCEAHCRRTGKPCPNAVVLGALRCRMHGGLSTGPATAAGRARISENNRRRSRRDHAE